MIYFIGDPFNGIDLTNILEERSINKQKRRIERKMGWSKGNYNALKDENTPKIIPPNQSAIEGERCDYIYYLKDYVIKRVKKDSLKGLLIRIFGFKIKWYGDNRI